jgi:membrane protein implicated in regulation of membrane protease activity
VDEPADDTALAASPGVLRTYLVYTGLRLAVFAGTAAALFLVLRINGFALLLAALLVSSIASLFLLRRQRDALVAAQERKGEARRAEKERLRAQLDQDPTG